MQTDMAWFERDGQRLGMERQLLAWSYPEARMVLRDGRISVFLRIVGRRRRYVIRIDYPRCFPHEPPAAFPLEPPIAGTPHQYGGNRLCLHSASDVGPQTTGKVICDWCVDWIRAYETWLDSGKTRWPMTNQAR